MVRLARDYPAASVNVQLNFDDYGRCSGESISDAENRVTRRVLSMISTFLVTVGADSYVSGVQ